MSQLFSFPLTADASAFDNVTSSGSGVAAWSSSAGLGGTTGGLSCTAAGSGSAAYGDYVFGALTSITDFRFRFYVTDVSLTLGAVDEFSMLWLERATGGIVHCSLNYLQASGVRYFKHSIGNDAGSPTTENVAVTNFPQWVELYVHRAATNVSADGSSTLYFGGGTYSSTGEVVSTISSIDNYDTFQLIAKFRIGMISGVDTGTSGVMYFDEIIARNDSTAIGPNNTAPVLTAIGNHRAVKGRAKLIVIVPTDTDSNLTKIAYLCDEAKGDWDCTLSGSASVTTGSKPSHTFEVTGTHAEIVATAATSTFTPTINTGSDTTCQITITDASAATDSETFTVECYGARVYGSTQAGINATLATLGLTHDTAEGATVEMTSVDSGDRTDVDGSVVTFVDNAAPTADAGPGQSVVVGQLVTLDGTGSSDPEDDTLTYQWTLVDEPTGSSVSLDDDTAAQPTFTPTHPGDYSFTLVVNDGTTDSAADGVTIAAAVGERVSASVASVMKARRRNLVHSPLRNRYRWRT